VKIKGPKLTLFSLFVSVTSRVKKDGQNIVSNSQITKALKLTPFFLFGLGTSCVK
jgi:hypothetical protein